MNDQVNRMMRHVDQEQAHLKKLTEEKLLEMRTLLDESTHKYNQKLNSNEKLVKDQIALQNESQLKAMATVKPFVFVLTHYSNTYTHTYTLKISFTNRDHFHK
jgi:hypothetical protein